MTIPTTTVEVLLDRTPAANVSTLNALLALLYRDQDVDFNTSGAIEQVLEIDGLVHPCEECGHMTPKPHIFCRPCVADAQAAIADLMDHAEINQDTVSNDTLEHRAFARKYWRKVIAPKLVSEWEV